MTEEKYDAIIVGSAFGGIYHLIHLRKQGTHALVRVSIVKSTNEFSFPEHLWGSWTDHILHQCVQSSEAAVSLEPSNIFRQHGITNFTPTSHAGAHTYKKHLNGLFYVTPIPLANSWHVGANIPEKKRKAYNYYETSMKLRKKSSGDILDSKGKRS